MSRAAHPMSDNELEAILRQARLNNEQHAITGALAYGNGQFMQIIEGEKDALSALYQIVANDDRHHDLVKFADKEIAQRSFPDWSMAFQTLSPQQFQQLAGYSTPEALDVQAQNLGAADYLLFQMLSAFGK